MKSCISTRAGMNAMDASGPSGHLREGDDVRFRDVSTASSSGNILQRES